MTTRRSFLGSILALAAAPAIVRAESLMPVAPPIWVPPKQKLYPCEIGRIDEFRIITSPLLPEAWVDRSDWGTRSVPASWGRLQAERQRLLLNTILAGKPPTT